MSFGLQEGFDAYMRLMETGYVQVSTIFGYVQKELSNCTWRVIISSSFSN